MCDGVCACRVVCVCMCVWCMVYMCVRYGMGVYGICVCVGNMVMVVYIKV